MSGFVAGYDAVEVTGLKNKPLFFETLEQCQGHVKENYVSLALFARTVIPEKTVRSISCFRYSSRPEIGFTVPPSHYSIKSEKITK